MTLRRLLLARSSTGHLCLVPTPEEDAAQRAGAVEAEFRCACGEVFNATLELSSYTTEYEPRCLSGFRRKS